MKYYFIIIYNHYVHTISQHIPFINDQLLFNSHHYHYSTEQQNQNQLPPLVCFTQMFSMYFSILHQITVCHSRTNKSSKLKGCTRPLKQHK